VHPPYFITAQGDPNSQNSCHQRDHFEEQTEVIENDHAVEQPTLLCAIEVKRGQKRCYAPNHSHDGQDPAITNQQIHDNKQQDSAGEDDLRIRKTQARDVLQIHE
jgi:hypothetical protein